MSNFLSRRTLLKFLGAGWPAASLPGESGKIGDRYDISDFIRTLLVIMSEKKSEISCLE